MPEDTPPTGLKPQPRFMEVPAGSFLWRIAMHSGPEWSGQPRRPAEAAPYYGGPGLAGPTIPVMLTELAAGADRRAPESSSVFREFNPETYDPRVAGRFDPTPECPFSYCYAAFDDLTAICEVLLRDQSFLGKHRYVPKAAVKGRQLTILETVKPLWLVSLLDATDLAAAGQDSWLIHAESPQCYQLTRKWAAWLRDSEAPGGERAAGLVWRAKREPGGRAVLLFGDENTKAAVVHSPFDVRPLDTGEGREWLIRRLELLRTRMRLW
ncbi:MAG TPA: RES family NAD+ phosphorylase [Trebonia sp.]|jgi:hypothetical protein|nr:RES family NAD+ phosphorylase [Trebonia sp.]